MRDKLIAEIESIKKYYLKADGSDSMQTLVMLDEVLEVIRASTFSVDNVDQSQLEKAFYAGRETDENRYEYKYDSYEDYKYWKIG